MFRNLNEDDGCFVNEALEIDEKEGDKKENKEDLSTIKIEIFRSKYDQQKLNEEMLYKKPSEKPSKYMLQVQGQTLFIRRVNSTLINEKKKKKNTSLLQQIFMRTLISSLYVVSILQIIKALP